MKIAVATIQNSLTGMIPETFEKALFLLIVETDTMEFLSVITEKDTVNKTIDFARCVLKWDCEAVICGEIERGPFLILAEEGNVTRYNGNGLSAGQAFEKMLRYDLPLIKEHLGGGGCPGEKLNKHTEAK